MNLRCGLQRLFAVLTVAWVAAVLTTVLSGRWEPWLRFRPPETRDIFDLVAASSAAPPPPGFKLDLPAAPASQEVASNSLPSAAEFMKARASTQRWEWAVGLSVIVPVGLYALLFYVLRWVYRGFRPAST